MTIEPNGQITEKQAKDSKKFLALRQSQFVWLCIVGGTLVAMYFIPDMKAALGTALLAEVLCLGFVQAGYILGQAGVDTFVRMASIIVGRDGARAATAPPPPKAAPEDDDGTVFETPPDLT